MYILVKLLQGYQEPLLYSAPDEWATEKLIGSIVTVPLRTTLVPAIITESYQHKPITERTFTIKQATSLEAFPHDTHYLPSLFFFFDARG